MIARRARNAAAPSAYDSCPSRIATQNSLDQSRVFAIQNQRTRRIETQSIRRRRGVLQALQPQQDHLFVLCRIEFCLGISV